MENMLPKQLGSSKSRSRYCRANDSEAQFQSSPGALASASCSAVAAATAAEEVAALAASLTPQVDKGELSRNEMDKVNAIVVVEPTLLLQQ